MTKQDRLYRLPIQDERVKITQGWMGPFSHKDHGGGQTDMTYAVDFGAKEDTPVVAARSGRPRLVVDDKDICYTGDDPVMGLRVRTNMVVIEHTDDDGRVEYSVYSHLKPRSVPEKVKRGQRVEEGEQIGLSGKSGWVPVPHVHFQVLSRDSSGERLKSRPVLFKDYDGPLEDEKIREK